MMEIMIIAVCLKESGSFVQKNQIFDDIQLK